MALFQASVLKSHLALLQETAVDKAYKKYCNYFWNTTIQENIKSAKEEQYQATFLNELFVTILGYTLFPNPDSNLTTEFKNEKNARKADGAILKDGIAIGVIELKGTNTKDLESIRRQAFDYKANQKGCVYVITSNFEKLRFYINDATEFEEFDLFTLSPERFKVLYLCLHMDNVRNHTPLKIKETSIVVEEEITKSFYKDYSIFKRELFRDLVKRNSKTVKLKLIETEHIDHQADITGLEKNAKLTLFKKSQKLIDRFLFIFFAEDRMLLPNNSTIQILNKWKDDCDFGDVRPLYDLFKQYFNFLDLGRKGTEKRAEIYAYNGGLFKPDAILDALEIDNDLLYKYTLKLSKYDFESQVDVNILGHIFENSLNEIESVNAEIEGGDFDKRTSKRKKDGVFYTPKYITKYIVENTVGKLCLEKKQELGFDEEQYFKGRKNRNKTTIANLVSILDDYRAWLLQLTICDPACGSGAFLNQALDFLIKEHSYIDELKTKILGGGLQFPDIENTILENNIYGVDLNEESVEIAKLSLWLRTAQPRRKLNDLSSNIKCGNSLIDSKAVAGDKAFKWEKDFPQVFNTKDLKAYHITTAVHDSRTSDRIVAYKVREQRDLGTNPYPNVLYFTDADDLIISQTIANIVREDGLKLLAYNICADHLHLLLVCELEDIPRIMQKIKSVTSRVLAREHNSTREHAPLLKEHAPLQKKGKEKKKPLWQQKYSPPKESTSTEQLDNTINYIGNNRIKHKLPQHSEQLQSIIDAMLMTKEEAFETKSEGGFDVVIGNPPYVSSKDGNLVDNEKRFYLKNFKAAVYQIDLYVLFIEKCPYLLKESGLVSLIVPNAWLNNMFLTSVRQLLLTKFYLHDFVSMPSNTFIDANVDTVIFTYGKVRRKDLVEVSYFERGELFEKFKIDQEVWLKEDKAIINLSVNKITSNCLRKIEKDSEKLSTISRIGRGVGVYHKRVGHTKQLIAKDPYQSDKKENDTFKPYIKGRNVNRWYLSWYDDSYISYGNWLAEPRDMDFFSGERIILRQIPSKLLIANYLNDIFITDQSVFIAKLNSTNSKLAKPLLGIINSKLMSFYFRFKYSEFDDLFPKVKLQHFKNFPIKLRKDNNKLEKLVDRVLQLCEANLNSIVKFQTFFSSQYKLEKLSRKLESWYELDFGEFIKELNKSINANNKLREKAFSSSAVEKKEEVNKLIVVETLNKKDEFEWMELFEDNKKKAKELHTQIAKTEKEIDQMVYELYGLSEEEITIVESS